MVKLFGRKVPKLNVTHFGQSWYARQPNIRYMHTCLRLCSLGCDWSLYRNLFQQSSKQNCFCKKDSRSICYRKLCWRACWTSMSCHPQTMGQYHQPISISKSLRTKNSLFALTFLGIAMGGWLAREALIACRPRMKQCDTVKDLKVPTCKWSPLVRVCRSVQTWVSKQFRFATNMLDKRISSKTVKYVILGTKRTKKKVSAESMIQTQDESNRLPAE